MAACHSEAPFRTLQPRQWVPFIAFVIALSLVMRPEQAIGEPKGDEIAANSQVETVYTEETVLSRSFVVGSSKRVRELAKTVPRPHHYQRSIAGQIVEERPPPKRCGVRVARVFRSKVVSTFNVAMSDDCHVSDENVSCATMYLPGYSRMYLILNYERRPEEVDLQLKARHRTESGRLQKARMASENVSWFEGLFDCLISVVECGDRPPVCARNSLEPRAK